MVRFMSVVYFLLFLIPLFYVFRFLSRTSLLHMLFKTWRSFTDKFFVYQSYKVPRHNQHFQPNTLYLKISTYLDSLPNIEDVSDFTNLFSSRHNSNDIFFQHDTVVNDTFLGANLTWTKNDTSYVLRVRKSDKRRVFRQYFQHIINLTDEIQQRNKDVKLYMNLAAENERWRSVDFTHPATLDTVAMEPELKLKVKADLELFLKSKSYYHRLGRVWKRSYLLYGPSGTGKTSFVAAMARFLSYDVYDLDLSKVAMTSSSGTGTEELGSELKLLLLQTSAKSLIVVEDLDRYLITAEKKKSTAGILSFMDGLVSSCGEERVLVFTMSDKGHVDGGDGSVLRPGRVDVHIHFPLCDFTAFKTLAGNYLGVKEHKLFNQVEEVFNSGGRLSPAEIGEIMISNRTSPSRALKSVISALQTNVENQTTVKVAQALTSSGSGRGGVDDGGSGGGESGGTLFCRESVHTVREFRKLYGLLRLGSRRKDEPAAAGAAAPPLDRSSSEKEGSRHERLIM